MYLGKGNVCATTNPSRRARELNQNQQKMIPVIWDRPVNSSPWGEMQIRGSNLALHLPKFFSMMAEERRGLKLSIQECRRSKVKAFLSTEQTPNPSGKLSHRGLYLREPDWTGRAPMREESWVTVEHAPDCDLTRFKAGLCWSCSELVFHWKLQSRWLSLPCIWMAKFTWTKVNPS